MKNIEYLKKHHPELCAENDRQHLLYGYNPYRPDTFAVISLDFSAPLAKLLIETAWEQNKVASGKKSGIYDFCVVAELPPGSWPKAAREARSAGYSSEMSPRSGYSSDMSLENPYTIRFE